MQSSTINNQHVCMCFICQDWEDVEEKRLLRIRSGFGCVFIKKYEKMKKVTSRKNEVLKSRGAEHMIYRVTQFPEMDSKSD